MSIDLTRCPAGLRAKILDADRVQNKPKRRSMSIGAPVSQGEELLALMLEAYGLEGWEREVVFYPGRKFRLDFAQSHYLLAVEVQGGVRMMGRHQRPDGFARDCEKVALAMTLGWRVLPVTTQQIKEGVAIEWIQKILARIDEEEPL